MKTLEQFKSIFPDSELDLVTDRVNVYRPNGDIMITLFGAREMIEEFFENRVVETNELDPQQRGYANVTPAQYIEMEYGDYLTAYNAI